jgi:hypothetical protein
MAENGSNGGGLQALWAEVKAIGRSVKQHDRVLLGNGHPGLVQTVSKLEGIVNGLASTIAKVEDSSRRMEVSAMRMEVHTHEMAKGTGLLKKRVAEVEAMVKPLIDWKRGVIIRITTMVATAGVILGGLWAAFENWDRIKAVFQ